MNDQGLFLPLRLGLVVVLASALAACGSSAPEDESAPAEDAVASSEEQQTESEEDQVADSDSASLDGGAGLIVIDGSSYPFEADFCFTEPDFVQISGPGVDDNGVSYYASISLSSDEDYDDDGNNDVAADVSIEFGAATAYDSAADDMASYSASLLESGSLSFAEFEYERTGDHQIAGSGEIVDINYVDSPSGDAVPFEFSGSCS